MEQPKSAQNLESRVELLEKLKDYAENSALKLLILAAAAGGISALTIYAGISSDPQTTPGMSRLLSLTRTVGFGGAAAASALVFGVMSALDYYRSKLLGDKIAMIKQSPEYKAAKGSGQDS